MPASEGDLKAAEARMLASIQDYAGALGRSEGAVLAQGLISTREAKDRLESIFVHNLRRFDKSGEYAADGSIDLVAWLRSKCRFSGSEAADRVKMGRQLDELPATQKAFASGQIGFHQVAALARTADHIGATAVRQQEGNLLRAAASMDSGQFINVVKDFEHRVDAEAALSEANRAHQRRYFNVSEPRDGMVRLEGLLDAEAGAIVRNAVNDQTPPAKNDERSPAQRRADRLVELCAPRAGAASDGSGARPHLIVRATVDTLAGAPNAPAGDIDGAGSVPGETVRRLACDAALTRITGKGELDAEISRATRTIPPATRRALAERDRGCATDGCHRPPQWTDAHHIKHWAHGGPTVMSNLVLLCRIHHRMVHEAGWSLQKTASGRWSLIPPVPRSRSA